MDPVRLGPVVPGRPALTAFLPLEEDLRRRFAAALEEARTRREAALAEAGETRREGEARLRGVVVEAQARSLREVEDRARDRVNAARAALQRWAEEAEAAGARTLDAALDLLLGAPTPRGG